MKLCHETNFSVGASQAVLRYSKVNHGNIMPSSVSLMIQGPQKLPVLCSGTAELQLVTLQHHRLNLEPVVYKVLTLVS